jgi:hypothetical protein
MSWKRVRREAYTYKPHPLPKPSPEQLAAIRKEAREHWQQIECKQALRLIDHGNAEQRAEGRARLAAIKLTQKAARQIDEAARWKNFTNSLRRYKRNY